MRPGLPGGGGSTIQGFRIINYSSNAITIFNGADGNTVADSQIGFTPLAAHNLITFKSHREALDAFAIRELIHHFVAYHKLVSPSTTDLRPARGLSAMGGIRGSRRSA